MTFDYYQINMFLWLYYQSNIDITMIKILSKVTINLMDMYILHKEELTFIYLKKGTYKLI